MAKPKIVINLTCSICKKVHINNYASFIQQVSIQPGHYDGYMATAYKMLCGHYCIMTEKTKGGYDETGVCICTTSDLAESSLAAMRDMDKNNLFNPANYVGEKN